ncbi:MAG: peptidylprolyl isomerase [Gammaproteobacteria bacterium]|nr:peptidylprolyl isomerase [Gammaproteobacteria bacterium]
MSDESALPKGMKLHLGIAEQGKLYALEGNHQMALMYYRYAMHLAVQAKDPEIFFRHYLECVIETLEQTESYSEVLEYCDKAIAHYASLEEEQGPLDDLARRDLAHIHQRKGVVLLKSGRKEEARVPFRQALELLKTLKQELPLSKTLLRWLESGLHIEPRRILVEQERSKYFSIRADTVNPERAIKLPNEQILMRQRANGT